MFEIEEEEDLGEYKEIWKEIDGNTVKVKVARSYRELLKVHESLMWKKHKKHYNERNELKEKIEMMWVGFGMFLTVVFCIHALFLGY